MDQISSLSPALKRLDFLVGEWNTTGEIVAGAAGPVVKIRGTDAYEWVSGGAFLLHRVDVTIGAERVEVVELIGYDEAQKDYSMVSFDSSGQTTTMRAAFNEKGALIISGQQMMSVLVASANGSEMEAHWLKSDDGARWYSWMQMWFNK